MKILVLSNFYPPYVVGGYEIICKDVVDNLQKYDFDIKVLTSKPDTKRILKDEKVCRLWKIDWPKKKKSTHLIARVLDLFSNILPHQNVKIFNQVIKKYKPDLIFVFSLSGLSTQLIYSLQKTSIPKLLYLCDFWLLDAKTDVEDLYNFYKVQTEDSIFKRMQKKIVLNSLTLRQRINWNEIQKNSFIHISHDLRQKYERKKFKCLSSAVITPGVKIDNRPGFQKKEVGSDINLLYVGRIVKEKGVHVLIEAMHYLLPSLHLYNIKLNIVGGHQNEDYLKELKNDIAKYNLEDNVVLTGSVSQEQVDEYYKKSHLLIFPSLWDEPFGQTQIEAMKYGLPVISSGRGGSKEIVDDGINGFLFDPNKPQECAQIIHDIIKDEELYAKLSFNAYNTVSKEFNRVDIIEKIVNEIKMIDSKNEKIVNYKSRTHISCS